jgi:cytochrome c oxidase subunit II
VGSSLDPAGPVAREMAALWWWMLGLGTAAFVLFAVLLGMALWRRRPSADVPSEPSTRGWLVGAGVVQPLVLITVVFALTLVAMRAIPDEAPDGPVVEITGHQWWYEIRYPASGVVTANEVHIPAGVPVELRLTSADVVHSFWVPALAGKIDLLPDGVNTLVIEADEPGTYVGDCAEFCGLQHTRMAIRVIAHDEAGFERWTAEQARPAEPPEGEVAQRGQELFMATCAECHAIAGTPADGRDGPDLTHLASRETLATGTVDNTAMALRDWVTDPHAIKEGVDMPATELDGDDLDALLTYLEGLGVGR